MSGRYTTRIGASIQGTLSNWVTSLISNRIAERQKRTVSDRAWSLYVNDAMAHGIIESLAVEIIGTGLTPIQSPMIRWLKQTPEWQQEYQQTVYDIFEVWGLDSRNFADTQGRMNIYMLQALALFMWKLDGIGVFQIVSKDSPYRPLSLSVLPIDPGRLVTPTDLQSSDNVYDGIEMDDNGAPVAAYILKPTRYGIQYSSARVADCTRIQINNSTTGLPNLLLVCDVRNVAEYRQDSILGSMIKEIRDSNDFVDAALVKALISNLITMFIQGYYNSTTPPDWSDRIKEIEKGTILMGNEGEIPHFFSNDTPGPGYDIMNTSIVGRLGMATGRGPENISKAYTASYSASQASMENAERLNDYDRSILVNRFCQPIHSIMQYEAALRGLLPVQSIDQFLKNLHAYTKTEWLPPKLRPIDKLKSANADQTRLGNMTRTWSDIYGEMSKDWRSQISQWMSEVQFALEDADAHGVPREVVLKAIGMKQSSGEPARPSHGDD